MAKYKTTGSISGVEIVEDNIDELMAFMQQAAIRALTRIGAKAEGYAKAGCPSDTGNLKNSITFAVEAEEEGGTVTIGTNVEYGIYVELGTGKYFEPPPEWMETHGGKKGRGLDRWFYQDAKGNWHKGLPRKGVKFLQHGVKNHTEEFENIITKELQKAP